MSRAGPTTKHRIVVRDTKKLGHCRSLVDKCIRTHQACRPDFKLRSTIRDLKVIHCIQRKVVPVPRRCRYLALSYVWRKNEQPSSLTGVLPQTIEDSITATLALGFEYLWIDRFCIEQNDDHKHQQLQQMGAIYATAEMTLIAAAGEDPTHGLPGISDEIPHIRQVDENAVRDCVEESRWSSRAWTYQEEYLSRRKLFFTDAGILYECGCISRSLINDRTWSSHLRRDFHYDWSILKDQQVLGESMKIMTEYMDRELSYESDALNAIIGIFNTIRNRDNSWPHIWGVPYASIEGQKAPNVLIAMQWTDRPTQERRSGYPSWSPLGWRFSTKTSLSSISVSEEFAVSLWNGRRFEDIRSGVFRDDDIHNDGTESQRIRVTAHCAEVDQTVWKVHTDGATSFSDGTLLSSDSANLHIRARWNQKDYLPMLSSLLAIFTSTASGEGFMLKRCGEYYERAGTFTVTALQYDSQAPVQWNQTSELCTATLKSNGSNIKKRTIIWI